MDTVVPRKIGLRIIFTEISLTFSSLSKISRNVRVTATGLARSVECLTAEREVAGSIPGIGPTQMVLK